MVIDEEFKGTHIFNDVTLVEIKPSVIHYAIYYYPYKSIYHLHIEYGGWVDNRLKYEKYIDLRFKNPEIKGKCTLDGKKFLMIGEKQNELEGNKRLLSRIFQNISKIFI